MTPKQLNTKAKIETVAALFGIDPKWAVAVAMTESSLGENQVSPTGCSGVFQMSQIAMKDLLLQMRAMARRTASKPADLPRKAIPYFHLSRLGAHSPQPHQYFFSGLCLA